MIYKSKLFTIRNYCMPYFHGMDTSKAFVTIKPGEIKLPLDLVCGKVISIEQVCEDTIVTWESIKSQWDSLLENVSFIGLYPVGVGKVDKDNNVTEYVFSYFAVKWDL